MLTAHNIMLILALVCFFCAALGRPNAPPLAIGWLGAFFVVLTLLIPA